MPSVPTCALTCGVHLRAARNLGHHRLAELYADRLAIYRMSLNHWRRHCRCRLAERVWEALTAAGYDVTPQAILKEAYGAH